MQLIFYPAASHLPPRWPSVSWGVSHTCIRHRRILIFNRGNRIFFEIKNGLYNYPGYKNPRAKLVQFFKRDGVTNNTHLNFRLLNNNNNVIKIHILL